MDREIYRHHSSQSNHQRHLMHQFGGSLVPLEITEILLQDDYFIFRVSETGSWTLSTWAVPPDDLDLYLCNYNRQTLQSSRKWGSLESVTWTLHKDTLYYVIISAWRIETPKGAYELTFELNPPSTTTSTSYTSTTAPLDSYSSHPYIMNYSSPLSETSSLVAIVLPIVLVLVLVMACGAIGIIFFLRRRRKPNYTLEAKAVSIELSAVDTNKSDTPARAQPESKVLKDDIEIIAKIGKGSATFCNHFANIEKGISEMCTRDSGIILPLH